MIVLGPGQMLWNKLDKVHMLYFKSSNSSIARVEEIRHDMFEVKVDGGIEAWEKIPMHAVFATLEEAKAYAEITAKLES